MPNLVKIRSEIFPKLVEAFLHDDDPLSDEQDWRNVFDYQWEKEEEHTGYAMLENDQVIGMMAMAFSTRLIDGNPHKFCNLHTWWVHEDYRSRSLAMLRPLLKLDNCTVTHFTPCDRIRALTKRLGFVDLNLQMKVLLPLRWFGSGNAVIVDRVIDDETVIARKLNGEDQQILCDHHPFRVGNLLIEDGNEYCYILYTHVVRYRFHYCHIHYVSDRRLYSEHEATIRTALIKKHGVRFVVIDARRVGDLRFPRSFTFWAPAHAVFRPTNGIREDQVDNLYSDVVMLRLAILPHVSHELKELARRWLTFGVPPK